MLRYKTPPLLKQFSYVNSGSGASIPFSVSEPTLGNTLVAWCSYSQYAAARTLVPPSGWLRLLDLTTGAASFAVFVKRVTERQDTAHTFSVTGSTENRSGVIVEVSGSDATELGPTIAVGASVSKLCSRDDSLVMYGWKRENYAAASMPAGVEQLYDTGGPYHQTVVGFRTFSKSGEDASATYPPGCNLSTVLVLAPRKRALA